MHVVIAPIRREQADTWIAMRGRLGPEWFVTRIEGFVREYFQTGRIDGLRHVVLLAARSDGTPVGFAEVSLRDFAEGCAAGPVGYLEGWFVEDHARRSGIGGALVAAAERWAAEQGCTEFASDAELSNPAGLEAHLALGFDPVCDIRCFRKSIRS
ncbi:MAG: GNAT family N-acetyltransferase [Phycisphaerales bacterium]|nr:GNAT family N-acetyltransferase [Phycisphaerales bacterium]